VTIVGNGPESPVGPQLFLAAERRAPAFITFAARARGRTEAYLPVCRDAIQSVDGQVPVFNVKTLDDRLADTLARPRFYTTAVLFFGVFGLLLAVIGVYGVASYSILQRTHELGVRIAIGASAQRMRWMLLRQSLLPVALGMVVGVAGAFGLGQFLQHLLDTAQRVDGLTCAIAAAALAAIASLAVWSATQRIPPARPDASASRRVGSGTAARCASGYTGYPHRFQSNTRPRVLIELNANGIIALVQPLRRNHVRYIVKIAVVVV
jgi:hypothetical protein